jgi:hypothetical protein
MGIIGERINIKKFPKSIDINGYIAFRIIDNSMESPTSILRHPIIMETRNTRIS